MNLLRRSLFGSLAILFVSLETFSLSPGSAAPRSGGSSSANSAERSVSSSKAEPTLEEELEAARKLVLADRPYRSSLAGMREVISLEVLPSALTSPEVVPDWWSEKQSYDLARLYALALSYYPIFKVRPVETWEQKVLSQEGLGKQEHDLSSSITGSGASPLRERKSSSVLNNIRKQVRFDIDSYSFQYMPVKRRGIGLGFIAITSKECSTETFLRSVAQFLPLGALAPSPSESGLAQSSEIGVDDSLVLNRMVIDKTGGASLNLNFLVGGAGGGNFDPPAKPLKRILLESVVDAAEAASCMASSNQKCIDYYKNLPRLKPTKLTEKQKKKVGSC